ncbi:MAG TPA: phosphotransferase, partial [Acidimicrobiales bacterium]|nr:phosphotransferase [Acidimicrobiales bacterium]
MTGETPASGCGHRVHGMGRDLVAADWPPLGEDEARAVLENWGLVGISHVLWHSPRPMWAAGLVQGPWGTVFVKRHDKRVRDVEQLAAEHALAGHLRLGGLPVPAVLSVRLSMRTGATTLQSGDYVYEVHQAAAGLDLYRDAPSWSPFRSLGHAFAAGRELARLHLAAAGFDLPARPPGVLMVSCGVVAAPDPLAAVGELIAERPGMAASLGEFPWQDDLERYHLPAIRQVAPLLSRLPTQWGHGDWHPSNLTWTSTAPDASVAGVIDLGLANRTSAVHDLAMAIERSAVSWLDLPESGRAEADLDIVDALL